MLEREKLTDLRTIVRSQLPASAGPSAAQRAQRFLECEVVASAAFPDVPFDGSSFWSVSGTRSQQRFIHGFLFFGDWVKSILVDDRTASVAAEAASRIVDSWVAVAGDPNLAPAMAYHDETTAQRLMNLLAIYPFVREYSHEKARKISVLMRETAELLLTDEFHATGNNHGMFQDLALLYWAILASEDTDRFEMRFYDKALERLRKYFELSFTEEGVHVENTPTYHLMVCRQISNVRRLTEVAGHQDATFYELLLQRASIYATHALTPSGKYPPISDTQELRVVASSHIFESPEFLYASTRGAKGAQPQERYLLLPKSGYAIFRSRWGDERATFIFFSAAYNADYHKHADDLSVLLTSGGINLLSESGPYGYDYHHPFSRYGYSQFAHNSLVVDNASLPRTDNRKEEVELRIVEEREDGFVVEGRNARYGDVSHIRRLSIEDSGGSTRMEIMDSILATAEHNYTLLWNLGLEVDVVLHGQGFELFHNGVKQMDLQIKADTSVTLELHEGVLKPKPLGWRFPKFGEAVPAKVVSVRFASTDAQLLTKIRLADFNYHDRNLAPRGSNWASFAGEVPLNYLFVPAKSENGRQHMSVVFSAISEPGDFTYNYKATVDQVDVSALYILDDFGDQGSYYHSDHRSQAIFRSVQNLIRSVSTEQGIHQERVAMVGSSKGGAAALMHGAAFGAGKIVVGAPQTRIGTFLRDPHPNMVEFMSGGTSEQDIEYLDGILFEKVTHMDQSTKISILVGQNDHHLRKHVEPLVAFMQDEGLPAPSLTILPELSHADIGNVYRHYLTANLEQWIRGSDEEPLPYILNADHTERSLRVKVFLPAATQVSYRLFLENGIVERRGFSEKDVVVFRDLGPGRYRIRVYTRTGEAHSVAFTTRWAQIQPTG